MNTGLSGHPVDGEVSITGISLRVPGADDVDALWRMSMGGHTTFGSVPRAESERYGYSAAQMENDAFVPIRSALDEADCFDHEAFGISARDAELMDPQHRIFLECARRALDDAGLDEVRGRKIGVFGSTSSSTYLPGPLRASGLWDEMDLNFSALLANDKDFLCARVSYALGLTGPSVVVQSACSSSLLAVHLARQALRRGECDAAVVGGVSISIPHLGGYLKRPGSIFSPTGSCRPFDSSADGTVKANGAAAVILRRSEDAEPDRVYARVTGTATNSDGAARAGFAAPGVSGQASVIRAALNIAGSEAAQVQYVETHGTGTLLGDPVEVRALRSARAGATTPCHLGSVKGNLGHLDAAAGITGLIRAALVLERGAIPPLAGFSDANPLLGLDEDLILPTESVDSPWLTHAGVSSFGMGGTNVHAILRRRDDALGRPVPPGGRPLKRTRHWIAGSKHSFMSENSTEVHSTMNAESHPSPGTQSDDLLATVRDVLRLPDLGPEENLLDAGADSLALIDVLAALADRHHIALDLSELQRIGSVGELFRLHFSGGLPAVSASIAPAASGTVGKPEPVVRSAIRLTPPREHTVFLAHPAGGTVTCYAGLAEHLGDDVGMVGLAYPAEYLGRDVTMRDLASSYVSTVLEMQPSGPYLIGGYSFGGNLAAEMALQLEAQGHAVDLLVMVDSHPPHAYTSGSCGEEAYVSAFPRLLREMIPGIRLRDDVRHRTDAMGILNAVEYPAWPESVRNELARFFDVWCANHGMLKRWTPDRSIHCPVLILEASEPEPPEVLDLLDIERSSVHEWERYLTLAPRVVGVDGDHYSIFRDDATVRRMSQILCEAVTQREGVWK